MSQDAASSRRQSNAYIIFILVLTVLSLAIMVAMLLPVSETTLHLLRVYDNLICVFFLIDFFLTLRSTSDKSDYFFRKRGWLDLLGSLPTLGPVFKHSGLLRLARLSRLTRILRRIRREGKKGLLADVLRNRSQYAGLMTVLMAIVVLIIGSVLVLQFESVSPAANIREGDDALWYSMVTITTVGYGDRYPVTLGGRIAAMFIMFMGVGIIGVLASVLSSVLLGRTAEAQAERLEALPASTVEQDVADIKEKLAAALQLLERLTKEGDKE
jgi:voltage-gated potassium channel